MKKKKEKSSEDIVVKKIGLFDLINDASFEKKNLLEGSDDNEKQWNIFIANLMLSQHPDCLLIVNQVNAHGHIGKKQHFNFLLHALPKRRRFAKLSKPFLPEKIKALMDFLEISEQKALEVSDFYTDEDMNDIAQARSHGGASR